MLNLAKINALTGCLPNTVSDQETFFIVPVHNANTLNDLKSALECLDPNDYKSWLDNGMRLKTLGEEGFELFDEWSQRGTKYNVVEVSEKWQGLKPERTGYKKVFTEAQEQGWINPAKAIKPDSLPINMVKEGKPFSLKAFSMQGQAEVMRKQMLDDVFVLAFLALLGQATTIYARANTGKTLLVLWMLIQSIIAGRIKGENVIYINADDTYAGFIQKLDLAEQYGFHMLMPNQNGFDPQAMQGYLRQMIDHDTARNSIIVLDTLKKFTDLMDKKAGSGFMSRVREFIAAGGTVISLAHTNKNKNGEGKSVFCGTSDVVDDCDCVYILDTVNTTDSANSTHKCNTE